MQTVTGLVSSFAMGTTVLLGQKIGAGRREEDGQIILVSTAFGAVMFWAAFFHAAFLIRVPVAWWMSRATGRLFHIGLGVPCSKLAQIIACFIFYAHIRKRRS